MIQAFGQFVVGGNTIVGIVVFLILIVIQWVVITNGAGRVSEVAARFTLDAMPGKQMSIDADLNAGLITEDEARARRVGIEHEADFYGAMDGASKFVKGDAVAALVIIAVNIVGGLTIGILQLGFDPAEAIATYTVLTVGEGLVEPDRVDPGLHGDGHPRHPRVVRRRARHRPRGRRSWPAPSCSWWSAASCCCWESCPASRP